MYMKLLEQTIKELKGEELEDELRANVNLRVDLRIDDSYIPDMNQRLTVYRRMAGVRSDEELEKLVEEVRDRYGPPPESVQNLAEYALHPAAGRPYRARVPRPRRLSRRLKVQARREARSGLAVPGRAAARRTCTLIPPATLQAGHEEAHGAASAGRGARPEPAAPTSGRERDATRSGGPGGRRGRRRARYGGFTKDEILRPATEDPRAEGGVFVAGVGPAARVERRPVNV